MKEQEAPKITRRKITDYLPDTHNANSGNERGLQMIEDSLHEDGVGRSIVADKHDKIPAGNKTFEAAVNAGIEDVIEIETDGNELIVHKRRNWDLDDPAGAARRYAYRDNRASELGLAWDADMIAQDVANGVDLSKSFYDWEVDKIMGNAQDVADREALWQGMPEFKQEDLTAVKQILVSFATIDDYKKFQELIGQSLSDKAKYVWYPKAQILHQDLVIEE